MNNHHLDPDTVVIPDTEEAQSLADRFAKFLVLGAAHAAGSDVSAALETAVEPVPVGQSLTGRSAVPHIQNQVGHPDNSPEAAGEVGVVCEQELSAAPDGEEPANATGNACDGPSPDQEGDQLCIAY